MSLVYLLFLHAKEEIIKSQMSKIEIKKVETKRDLRRFIDFHYDLYKGNPYDVPNLFSDDMNTLRKDRDRYIDEHERELERQRREAAASSPTRISRSEWLERRPYWRYMEWVVFRRNPWGQVFRI